METNPAHYPEYTIVMMKHGGGDRDREASQS